MQSGTGKTAIYAIAALQIVDTNIAECQVWAIMPTRELTMAVNSVIQSLGEYVDNLSTHAAVGGTSIRNDIQQLTKGVQILTSTPGRGYDMIQRGVFQLKHLKLFVIDEAIEIFNRGFKEVVYDVMEIVPSKAQLALFSDKLDTEIEKFTGKYMPKAIKINHQKEEINLDGVKQYYVNVQQEQWKLETLKDLLSHSKEGKTVIFVNTRRKCEWIMNQDGLRDNNDLVGFHGDMRSDERAVIMQEWKDNKIGILLSTDLFARGIDSYFKDCKWIINYDLPMNRENYIHRVGNNNKRPDSKPVIINLVCDDSKDQLKDIETFYNTCIDELPTDVFD